MGMWYQGGRKKASLSTAGRELAFEVRQSESKGRRFLPPCSESTNAHPPNVISSREVSNSFACSGHQSHERPSSLPPSTKAACASCPSSYAISQSDQQIERDNGENMSGERAALRPLQRGNLDLLAQRLASQVEGKEEKRTGGLISPHPIEQTTTIQHYCFPSIADL